MLTRPSKLVTVIPWQVHSKILPVDCQWEQTRIWPTKGPEYASVLPSPARTPHYPGQSVYTIVDCNRCKLPESGTRRGWKYIPHHSCNWTEDGLEGNSITIFSQPPHVAELVKFFFFLVCPCMGKYVRVDSVAWGKCCSLTNKPRITHISIIYTRFYCQVSITLGGSDPTEVSHFIDDNR